MKKTQRLAVDLPEDMHQKLKQFCSTTNESLKDFVSRAIKEKLPVNDLEREVPQNLDAERIIIGIILIQPDIFKYINEVVWKEEFFDPFHRKIYGVMEQLSQENDFISLLTIKEEFKKNDPQIDGADLINNLVAIQEDIFNDSSRYLYSAIKIVKANFIFRRVLMQLQCLVRLCFEQNIIELHRHLMELKSGIEKCISEYEDLKVIKTETPYMSDKYGSFLFGLKLLKDGLFTVIFRDGSFKVESKRGIIYLPQDKEFFKDWLEEMRPRWEVIAQEELEHDNFHIRFQDLNITPEKEPAIEGK
ncbi:MAG: DnaB-like helicase N-terminal domain-containing protein [Nitrosopumilaceae archaeon]|nr:DnaB-like helicase N-terminal domain-containing protein [Nitrosopumilaceae archaeon]